MLVEGPHKSRHNVLRGRLRNGRICHVSGTKELIGHLVPVRITEAFSFSGDDDWNEPKGDQSDWKQQHWKAHDNRSVSSWKNWDQSWEDHDKGDDNKSKSTVTTSHRGSFFRLGGLLSTGGRFSSSGGVEGEGDWEETEEDISRKWNADEAFWVY
eukprot:symbB.v1.2.037793.t1/scaffold5669.1/size24735/1